MTEIIILGFGEYKTKAGAQRYVVSFQTPYRDNLSRITTGMECETDSNVDPETYARISQCKIGDKLKAAICRDNFKLHIVCLI